MVMGAASEAMFQALAAAVPGGVMSPARSYAPMGLKTTLVMARGEGTYLYDVDGRRYIDMLGAFGPGILGHGHPAVVAAVRRQVEEGVLFGTPSRHELAFVERVREAVPELAMLRLVSTGTEAVMSAVRLARAATGRRLLVKFAGDYHGHFDAVLAEAGSGASSLGGKGSAGVPAGVSADVVTLPYNDLGAVESFMNAMGEEVAAILVEPISGNMGVVNPVPGFLTLLRRLCDATGAMLIYDEVILGFRLRYGAAFPLVGPPPDLVAFGKVLGGGLPLGLYGGRAELMRQVVPLGNMFQAGTHAGNPLSLAAAMAALDVLGQEGTYSRLEALSERLEAGLRVLAARHGLSVVRAGSMLSLFFRPEPPRNYAEAKGQDAERFRRFFRGMLERGVLLAPSPLETWFLNVQMTEEHVDAALSAAAAVLAEMDAG